MTDCSSARWAVLGTGNIGRILALRLRVLGVSGDRLFLHDPDPGRRDAVAAETGARICASASEAAESADVILLAVPPKVVVPVMKALADKLCPAQVVVSFAAGLPLARLTALVPDGVTVARVMPNAPSLVGKGMNPVAYGPATPPAIKSNLEALLGSLGDWVEVRDDQMNWCVGLAGAAMRSVLPVIEGMAQAGVEAGLSKEEARRVAAHVVKGTADMLLRTPLSFDEIKSLTPMQTVDEEAVAAVFHRAAVAAKEKVDRAQEKLIET